VLFTRCNGKNPAPQPPLWAPGVSHRVPQGDPLSRSGGHLYLTLGCQSGRTVGCLVSYFSASVAQERKQLHFPTSVNVHRNRVSRGRSMLMVRAPLRSLKLNGVEGGWTGQSRSNTRSSVGRSESFIGGSVLVNGPGCSVPVHWNHV